MKDQYGRQIDYMRVSVTDRCNLRCIYCMPEEGVKQVFHQDILTYDEIARIVNAAASVGITRIKLTGGEPLVRKNLAGLVSMLTRISGIKEVTLTTNGVLLQEQLHELMEAGISAVNISLDTLDENMYSSITRRDCFHAALRGLEEAAACPELKVKVNCVSLRGVNEGQLVRLAGLAKDRKIDVRFIEIMPIGLGKTFRAKFQEEILDCLRKKYGKEEVLVGRFGNGPASYVKFEGFQGNIGFISALTHKFCPECNRIRLTAEGFLKPCLQYSSGEDLRKLVRGESSDGELVHAIESVINSKPACHYFEKEELTDQEQEKMFRIGG